MDGFTRLILAVVWVTVCCVAGASVVAIALMLDAPAGVLALVSLAATVLTGVFTASGFAVLRG